MNDIMSDLGESSNNIIGSTQKSNSEDELLTPFFSSPTMNKMLEVRVIQTFDRDLKPTLEKLVRNVIKHELELAEKKFLFPKGNPEKYIQAPRPRSMNLKFLTKVSVPVLTGVEVKADGGNSIEVALVDDNSGEIVDSGREASAKVEIVVLKGEFGDDDGGNWTAEEFCSNVVREREGKKSLLAETVHVRLNKGIGSVDKIRFTHSSIYMKTRMFRLGARIVDTFNTVQVKEARTESFTVKDGRQRYYEKHDPPALSDGVHRLKNIGKRSINRLWDEKVNTVEDFLILLLKDSERLKCVLNIKPKMLEETTSHARRCIINERIYSYVDLQEKKGVVFNIVGEVQGLILEFQYLPMHQLSESDKANAQRLLLSACEHWDHVVTLDNRTSLVQYLSQILPTKNPSNSPSREIPITSNGAENFRTSDEHCYTSFQGYVSSVIPARGAIATSLNDPGSSSISNLEFSNSPIYSPSVQHFWSDQCNFEYIISEFDAHQPHDASASKVKEEVELALRKYMTTMKRNCGKDVYACELRTLKLKFLDLISPPVFTGTRIEGKDSNLKVALVDVLTGKVVFSGPESCAKVEIVVLEGDFDSYDGDNWTAEEFKSNIVRGREGKKPLLTGDEFLYLKEGIGWVSDISFTDNSSWTRSRKFRLGARLVDSFEGTSVREAKTESFIVRDHRGELYKKHHPPSLSDEVWRLEKIGKDGAFHRRLSKERINAVKDFLTLLYLDPTRLRNVLGTGMSTKMWEVTVEHARTCLLDKKVLLYYPSVSVPKTGVVFNIVGQMMGLLPDCRFVSADKLSETQKDDARNLVICAFRHWEEVVSFEDESSLMDWVMQLSAVQFSSNSPMVGTSDASDNVLTSQKISRSEYQQLSASTPDIMPSFCSIAGFSSLDDYVLHGIDNMDVRFDQPLNFPGQDTNSLMADTDSITHPSFCDDDHLPFFDTDYSLPSPSFVPSPDLQCAVNSFLAHSSTMVPLDKAQRRWKMLFSVLRWFSVRRIVNKRAILS